MDDQAAAGYGDPFAPVCDRIYGGWAAPDAAARAVARATGWGRVLELDVFVGDEDELAEVRWMSLPEVEEAMAAYDMFGPVHERLRKKLG